MQGDFWLCLRRTKLSSYSDTHEVRFKKYKRGLGKGTYVESYSDNQPGGNARVSGFCGPDVDVVGGIGEVGGGPSGWVQVGAGFGAFVLT
jgi:hypothetical protein